MRCSITGTTARPSARCSAMAASVASGSNVRLQDGRRGHAEADAHVDEPPGVEQRRGDDDGAAGADRHDLQQRRQRADPAARRPAMRPSAGRWCRTSGSPGGRRAASAGTASAGAPRRTSPAGCRTTVVEAPQSATIAAEGVVVEDGVDALVGDDVGELRRGEAGVQVHDVGAELGGGDDALHEHAAVAGEDPDRRRRAGRRADAVALQPARDAVGAEPQVGVA